MPRNGTLVRITLALAAAALLGALAVTSAGAAGKHSAGTLNGAGSSLVGPAVAIWSTMYTASQVNYSSIGSGGGIKQISARTVDFGASDAPLTKSQGQGCVKNGVGCIQIPWALTATSPVVNIPGVGPNKLRLTGTVLANIYLGNITNWNDPAIAQLNKGLSLPNLKITPVHRSDGSGDTYVFTNYLSKVNKAWKSQVGCATSVSWPTGVGGNHNNGVAAVVASTPGSIGYVSVAYVIANHLHLARLKNASGKYVLPTLKSIESSAALVNGKRIPANNKISITNPPKATKKGNSKKIKQYNRSHKKFQNAYPLATFTYILVPQVTPKAAELKAFVTWALGAKAQNAIKKLVFAPMPTVVVKAAKKTLAKIHS